MGKITTIGNIDFEGETRTGIFIECSKEELKSLSKLFLEEVSISLAQSEDSGDKFFCGYGCCDLHKANIGCSELGCKDRT